MRLRNIVYCLFFGAGAALVAQQAHAVCSPFLTYKRVVGDTASDKNCTDNTIQDAIDNTTCPNTTIYITSEHKYLAQHLLIEGKTLSLVGTDSPTCSIGPGNQRPDEVEDTPLTPLITLSGAGHSGDSVISIQDNSNVTLQFLTITGGASDKDQFGGGIYYKGQGSLTLNTTDVTQNFAGYGGGINIEGSGSGATLTLDRVQIAFNTAQYNGGGIRAEGTTHIYMLDASSSISFNHTVGPDSIDPNGGHGGGIALFGPAIADLASPAALLSNSATYGGGIAVLATSSGNATARLFGTNGLTVGVLQNRASVIGGAAFVHSTATGSDATLGALCAENFRIDANIAPQGAAIFGDGETDGSLGSYQTEIYFNSDTDCEVEPTVASLGAATCTTQPCNELSENLTEDGSDQPTDGAVLAFNMVGTFDLNRFAMRNNNAGNLMSVLDTNFAGGNAPIRSCLIADNHTSHEVIYEDHADMSIRNCTFANNTIDHGSVFFADHGFQLNDSIVWQPGNSIIDYQDDNCGNCEITNNDLSNDTSTFAFGSVVLQPDDPLFVDLSNADSDLRDYHLVAFLQNRIVTASEAIDAAPTNTGDGKDLDGNPTDVDVLLVKDPNPGWWHDIGAYEAQPITDRIFGDTFGDRLSLLK